MSEQKFKVEMTCGGCSKSVNGVLTKTKGVEKVFSPFVFNLNNKRLRSTLRKNWLQSMALLLKKKFSLPSKKLAKLFLLLRINP